MPAKKELMIGANTYKQMFDFFQMEIKSFYVKNHISSFEGFFFAFSIRSLLVVFRKKQHKVKKIFPLQLIPWHTLFGY